MLRSCWPSWVVWSWASLCVTLTVLLCQITYVGAAPLSYQATASVAPAVFIVTNKNLAIQEIISNSNINVTPTAWLGKVGGQQINLSPALYDRYRQLVSGPYPLKMGLVYNASTANPKAGISLFWVKLLAFIS